MNIRRLFILTVSIPAIVLLLSFAGCNPVHRTLEKYGGTKSYFVSYPGGFVSAKTGSALIKEQPDSVRLSYSLPLPKLKLDELHVVEPEGDVPRQVHLITQAYVEGENYACAIVLKGQETGSSVLDFAASSNAAFSVLENLMVRNQATRPDSIVILNKKTNSLPLEIRDGSYVFSILASNGIRKITGAYESD